MSAYAEKIGQPTIFSSSSFGLILYHQMLSAVVWSQSTVS